jgi:hypothetical protein
VLKAGVSKEFSMTGAVPASKRRLLADTSPALVQPDYERVRFMNRLLSQLWPHLSPAIHKQVMEQSAAAIQDAIKRIPLVQNVRIDVLDLGTRPFRVDSFKSYMSHNDDNWIMFEAPLLWGGDMRVRVVVEVSFFGLFVVGIPVEVANVQLKALARVTLYPLVEQLPCVGGASVCLLEEPTVDLDLHILDSPDLLSLPPIPVVLGMVKSRLASKILVYPNELSFPILPNYGLPTPPIGVFRISVCYGINLKSSFLDEIDPFVSIELRNGRMRSTAALDNEQNPVWKDEEFDMLVDDLETQSVTIELLDHNNLSAPGLVGAVVVPLKEMLAAGFCQPNARRRLLVPVFAPQSTSKKRNKRKNSYEVLGKEDLRQARHCAFIEDKVKEEVSKRPQAKLLIPYLMRKRAAKMARQSALKQVEAIMREEAGEEEQAAKSSISSMVAGVGSLAAKTPLNTVSKQLRQAVGQELAPNRVGEICIETTFIPLRNGVLDPRDDAVGEAVDNVDHPDEIGPDTPARSLVDGRAGETATSTATSNAGANHLRRTITLSTTGPAVDSSGVLSVHIIKATQLSASTATYVELVCQEQGQAGTTNKKRIHLTTPQEYDPNPKFDYRTDLNVKARSTLTLSVYKVGMDVLRRRRIQRIGYAVIEVLDVVEVGLCRDAYSLIGADAGELHVACEWLGLS